MKAISIKDARSLFSRLLQEAENGQITEITRYGKPVARIMPVPKEPQRLPSLKKFREEQKPQKESLTETLLKMRQEERY